MRAMDDQRFPIGRFQPSDPASPAARADLIAQIDEVPDRLRQAVQGLSADQLRTPYRDGGWTLAQVVHHLPDSHANAYVRFRLALTEEAPTIKPYIEGRWAELSDASSPDIGPSLLMLEGLHRRWTSLLRSMTDDQWQRPFHHPERGPSTLGRQLALYAWHGRHHVAHITSLRQRMGW